MGSKLFLSEKERKVSVIPDSRYFLLLFLLLCLHTGGRGGMGPKIFFHPPHTKTSSWPNFAHFSWGGKINLRLSPRGRILESEKSSR